MSKGILRMAIGLRFVTHVIHEIHRVVGQGVEPNWLIQEDREQRMDLVTRMLNCRTQTYINSNTNMAAINEHKRNNVMNGSPEERYSFFIRKVVDFEMVWSLYKDGWALVADDKHQQAIPFWPEEDFAGLCAIDIWEGYSPRPIELSDLVNKWLPGMAGDRVLAAIFLNTKGKGVFVLPEKLTEDISAELSKY